MLRSFVRGIVASCSMALLLSLLTQCEPTPATCNADTCGSNQVRVCLDKCATVVEPNARCNLDLCAANARICGVGRFCFPNPNDPGFGTCQANFQGLGALDCNSSTCGTGLYCRASDCNSNGRTSCSLPVQSGQACDSDVGPTAKCFPCEPGTSCIDGFCSHACTSDDACPCNAGYKCATSVVQDVTPGYCYQCRNRGEACDVKGDTGSLKPCCDGSVCRKSGTTQFCCTPVDGSCTSGADCCDGLYCSSSNKCGACVTIGGNCTEDAACCGNKCTNGHCAVQCVPGASCVVPNKKGACAKGTVKCTNGTPSCEGQAPGTETCNGQDDDCDGVIDNIPATACTVTPTGCQSGFNVDGVEKCALGSPFTKYCAVKSQGDFCKVCDNGPTCGYCGGTTGCDPGGPNYCVPGTSCVFNGSAYVCQTINGCGAAPNCYLPKTVKDRANQCF